MIESHALNLCEHFLKDSNILTISIINLIMFFVPHFFEKVKTLQECNFLNIYLNIWL